MFGLEFSNLLEYVDTTSPEIVAIAEIHRGTTTQETAKITYNSIKRKFTYIGEKRDKWQKPLETLARGLGDCEDLAIFLASLFTINNIPNWLLVVKNHQWQQYHVLNAVEIDGKDITLLDVSIKQDFDSKPYYQDNVFIYGFYAVNSTKPSFPLIVPLPLNLFMMFNSSIRKTVISPLGSN